MEKDFYTFSEYMKKEDDSLTASMEDYLEMIYRLSGRNGFTRINELSAALNVQPPSATKMVQKLSELKLIKYEKYGVIMLEEEGRLLGENLIKRHNVIANFLSLLGVPDEEILTETEKIEHTVSEQTMKCFNDFICFMNNNPDIRKKYISYIEGHKSNLL
ncbi:MAG: iron dependent repressor, metal binding and dimerization domain protein [Thermoanaerobacteraceae bacterium]|nr:iron dependent repressor, metal binding and dimerization domain protein [Thermoanaerobacteraceae bacterium]